MKKSATLVAALQKSVGDQIQDCSVDRGEVTIRVAPEELIGVCVKLRDQDSLAFDQLMDLCAVDYLYYGQQVEPGDEIDGPLSDRARFDVVYHLQSLVHNWRLRVKVGVDGDPPVVDSVDSVWNSAVWYEREAFDLFGVLFSGHPDLRRILTDYGFIGHPFRKDFPISGHVEMRYSPDQARVVYEPVSIEPRVGTARVIRDDFRYERGDDSDAGVDAA